jgi:hypothetical protein
MNKKIKELAEQAGFENGHQDRNGNSYSYELEKFAELIVKEAFRDGILYSAKKYRCVGYERFTGNDVALFLEMESCEVSDDDILEHFEVEE